MLLRPFTLDTTLRLSPVTSATQARSAHVFELAT
jgi:hypothetical protein